MSFSEYGKSKAEASATSAGIIPVWLSLIFFCLFVGGCIKGGCAGGFRGMIQPVVEGYREASK